MWKYLILLLQVNNFVCGKMSNMMIDIERKSWLKEKDFETMIKYSHKYSICCNIIIDGSNDGIDALFDQFIEIYDYEYTIQRVTYECSGFFVLGSTGEGLARAINVVPTTIASSELLILVDGDLESNSPLFNISIYEYSNVNIVSRTGIWTLSENFLQPREFRKVTKYEEMEYKSGVANLQRRELQIATFYVPPFSYLSTTVNETVNGIEGEFYPTDDRKFQATELDGVEVQLFLIMAERMNFTYKIRKPNHNYRYGRANGSTWNGGMIGQLFRKEIDLAFGGIWLRYDQHRFVNLSTPWYMTYIHYLVPRPKPTTSFWALTRPLSIEVWITVITIVLVQSISVWYKARINPQVPSRFKSFVNTLTELMARLIGSWAPRQTHGLRIQLHLWHFAGLLVVTAYSSSLAARLTSPDWDARIDTVKQFIDANLSWGREGPIPKFDDYFDLKDQYAVQMPERFHHEESQLERHLKILEGNYAIVGRIIHSMFFPEDQISPEDLRLYRVMKNSVGEAYLSFAMQPWLENSINKVLRLKKKILNNSVMKWENIMMLHLTENGLSLYHLRNVIHRRAGTSLREVLIEHDGENADGAKPLELKPLGAAFLLLIMGYLVATVVFYCELQGVTRKKSIACIRKHIKKGQKRVRRSNNCTK